MFGANSKVSRYQALASSIDSLALPLAPALAVALARESAKFFFEEFLELGIPTFNGLELDEDIREQVCVLGG